MYIAIIHTTKPEKNTAIVLKRALYKPRGTEEKCHTKENPDNKSSEVVHLRQLPSGSDLTWIASLRPRTASRLLRCSAQANRTHPRLNAPRWMPVESHPPLHLGLGQESS